ncbi:siderophore esterase [Penicillium malachiteum]|uniref:siderophore esterase n=1 Tax=Penicillium malachiteum TaxID=1324776 RepID=UPI0025494F24|nr:siderophore esterase [Penicillium malachiteum]KAJ5715369.1 siderophore esterase [Penicillium malachiteum]
MGETVDADGHPTPVSLPNSEQFYLKNDQGRKYSIQVSWPLLWEDREKPRSCPIIYLVDGNSMFLTATESAWRRGYSSRFNSGIIVAIGYPLEGKLYDIEQRNLDLTPPSETPVPGHGQADGFLDFIENSVKPAVRSRFPKISFEREALFGHSYGGLFALHALFTRPDYFDCFMASSPSIWWNGRCILDEAEKFLDVTSLTGEKVPSVIIPPRWDNESNEDYDARKQTALGFRMTDNALDLLLKLEDSTHLRVLLKDEYEWEEHLSIVPCSVSRALTKFFEEWPFEKSES